MSKPRPDDTGGLAGYTPQLSRYSELASIAAARAALDDSERIAIRNARILDLIGDPDWPQDKIKTRLQKVRESKQRITHQLKDTTDDLEPGRAVLNTALELLDRPHDLYHAATDQARKMLNKAIFTRLYLNSTDRQPTATAATLSEPFASLIHATRTTRRHQDATSPHSRPQHRIHARRGHHQAPQRPPRHRPHGPGCE